MEEGLGHLGSQRKTFQAVGSPPYALGATTEDGPRGGMSSDGWRFRVESVALRYAFGVICLTVTNAGALAVVFMVLLLLCALVVCTPYAVWVIYSMFKRRWRRVGLQLAIPGVILLMLAGAGAVWYSL